MEDVGAETVEVIGVIIITVKIATGTAISVPGPSMKASTGAFRRDSRQEDQATQTMQMIADVRDVEKFAEIAVNVDEKVV